MELEHAFTVPVGVEEAWRVLRDIERIGPCMPGATITGVDGEHFTGTVKVKVGPITVQYKGEADFVDVDEAAHTARIEAKGRETKGSGTARATVSARLQPVPDGTEVRLVTDLAVTGKPAQFGRGVMADVGAKLIGQFADCLSEELGAPEDAVPAPTAAEADTGPIAVPDVPPLAEVAAEAAGAPAGAPAGATGPAARERRTDDTIDLFAVAGAPVARRAAPVAGGLALLLLLWWLARRTSRSD